MENHWLSKANRLHALAESGLAFSKDDYDIERYEEIAEIARKMMSDLTELPVNKIQNMLVQETRRYVSPQIDVRGAVIKNDKILLVKEKVDGLWTLPGGYADVGLSAAENVVKEVFEEACLKVEASQLYAIRHKAKGDYNQDIRDFYKLFFLCTPTDNLIVKPGPETLDADFFPLNALPSLSSSRVIERDIANAFAAHSNAFHCPLFD